MAQFLDHREDGTFMLYYTRPSKAGNVSRFPGDPEAFEHIVRVNLSELKHPKSMDGKKDDTDQIQILCPCGCGMSASVPIAGGSECQELHVHKRAHDKRQKDKDKPVGPGKITRQKSIDDAVDEVEARLKEMGQESRLDKVKGKDILGIV
jgi:hypothetical protein